MEAKHTDPLLDQDQLAADLAQAVQQVEGVVTVLTPPTLGNAWNSGLADNLQPVKVKLPGFFHEKVEVDVFIEVTPKIPAAEVGFQVQQAADRTLRAILPANSQFSVNVHILRIARGGFAV